MKRLPWIYLLLILLTLMGAGGAVRGDDGVGARKAKTTGYIPPAWSLKLPASERFQLVLDDAAVLDKETGLVWEKSPDITIARTWADAIAYTYGKTVGGRDGWRLPTMAELKSLVDKTQAGLVLPSGHPFQNVQPYYYWSATTDANNTSNAWGVYFFNGNVVNVDVSKEFLVWCVRSGQGDDGMAARGDTNKGFIPPAWSQKLPASERFQLVLDDAGVLDKETGLVWEKRPASIGKNWSDSVGDAYDLKVGGRKGWRLPTIEELESLMDPTQTYPSLPQGHPFQNVQWGVYCYWSATTSTAPGCAWAVDFNDGSVYRDIGTKSNSLLYMWCVRGGHGYDGK